MSDLINVYNLIYQAMRVPIVIWGYSISLWQVFVFSCLFSVFIIFWNIFIKS